MKLILRPLMPPSSFAFLKTAAIASNRAVRRRQTALRNDIPDPDLGIAGAGVIFPLSERRAAGRDDDRRGEQKRCRAVSDDRRHFTNSAAVRVWEHPRKRGRPDRRIRAIVRLSFD